MTARPAAKIISRKDVFKRFFRMEVVEAAPASLRHDGDAAPIEREVMRVGDVAVILLYDPARDEILVNQQFRMGAFLAGDEDPFFYECAAGLIDEGETPEQAARREAREETGTEVLETEFICAYHPSPGCSDERHYLYVGRIERPKAGLHGVEEEAEEIRTHVFPAARVVDMLDGGTIRNAATMIAVHWFARNREALRKKWLKA